MTADDLATYYRVKDRLEAGVTTFRECTRDEFFAIMRVTAFYVPAFEALAKEAVEAHHRTTDYMNV